VSSSTSRPRLPGMRSEEVRSAEREEPEMFFGGRSCREQCWQGVESLDLTVSSSWALARVSPLLQFGRRARIGV